jgi:hypothetical protein
MDAEIGVDSNQVGIEGRMMKLRERQPFETIGCPSCSFASMTMCAASRSRGSGNRLMAHRPRQAVRTASRKDAWYKPRLDLAKRIAALWSGWQGSLSRGPCDRTDFAAIESDPDFIKESDRPISDAEAVGALLLAGHARHGVPCADLGTAVSLVRFGRNDIP